MPRLICGFGNGWLGRCSRHGLGLRLVEQVGAAAGAVAQWSLHPRLGAYVLELPEQAINAPRGAADPDGGAGEPGRGAVGSEADGTVYLLWPLLPYNAIGWSVVAAGEPSRAQAPLSFPTTPHPTHLPLLVCAADLMCVRCAQRSASVSALPT